jgi:hypothetical protein
MREMRKRFLLFRGSACPAADSEVCAMNTKCRSLPLDGGKIILHVGFTCIAIGPGFETKLCKRRMSRAVDAARHSSNYMNASCFGVGNMRSADSESLFQPFKEYARVLLKATINIFICNGNVMFSVMLGNDFSAFFAKKDGSPYVEAMSISDVVSVCQIFVKSCRIKMTLVEIGSVNVTPCLRTLISALNLYISRP